MDSEKKGGEERHENLGTQKANTGHMRGWGFPLRFFALVLTLTAAIILGVNTQTTHVTVSLLSSLPPVTIPVTAKWHHLSAFVFFVVANAVASAYAAISLVVTLADSGSRKSATAAVVAVADLLTVALLFSAVGAAMAIGIMGYEGNSHVQWKKVCNVFGRFCGQGVAALGVSFAGAIAFLLMAAIALLNRHKKG